MPHPSVYALIVACVVFVAATGCGPTAKDRLVGKWKGTVELDPAAVDRKAAEATDPVSAMIGKAALTALSSTLTFEMTLHADGKFESESRFNKLSEKSSGTWEVKASDAHQATLAVTEKSGTREYVVVFDPDFMTGAGGFSTATWGESAGLGKVKFVRASP